MKKLLILATAVVAFAACSKDDDKNDNPTKTRTELLTAGKWYLRALVDHETMPDDTTYDYFAEMEDCDKDNFLQFNSNGTYTSDEGASKCDPDNDQVLESGTWKFIENETKIVTTYTYNGTSQSDTTPVITKLDASSLVLSETYDDTYDGTRYTGTYTITMGH